MAVQRTCQRREALVLPQMQLLRRSIGGAVEPPPRVTEMQVCLLVHDQEVCK